MPRNPGARKHQHNNRHENGLVGPGKRVTKQKSNGQLNGNVKGAAPNDPSINSSNSEQSVTAVVVDPTSTPPPDLTIDPIAPPSNSFTREVDLSSDTQVQDHANKWESSNGITMAVQRKSEVSVVRNRQSQDVSALYIASTILKSRPACDTIALLIVLLALPSMLLTIVQALFASLTLMPGAGISPISFLSLFDVFQGSAGSPSLGTMAVVDLICFGLWICLWSWAQNFALDLAQIQIAITLGNGSSGKTGSINTFCFAMVLFLHSIRSKGVRQFLLSKLFPAGLLSQPRFAHVIQYLPQDADFGESPGAPSKIRSAFAIHIISQALMAFVRRRVASTQTGSNSKISKRIDNEASAGTVGSDGMNAEGISSSAAASGVDYQPPPTPGLREGKDKGLSAKKRRRQANHVRSRQPFWAALASTKVHVLREVEHSQGLPTITNHQNVPFEATQRDLVWVVGVDPSSIDFETNFISTQDSGVSTNQQDDNKPFYVRINGARWHSVTLERLSQDSRTDGPHAQWLGEISGLAPNCTYTCSFIRTEDDEEFASVMVKTPVLLDKDVPPTFSPAPVRQSMRPSSPTTTLKNSINNAEAKLADARKRLAQVKKQHKASLNKVDREVESLGARVKSGADDTKLRQKLLQTERNMRQTEDSTNSIRSALEGLETVPEDETVEHTSSKVAYEDQKSLLAEANETLNVAKSSAENDLTCINGELHTISARRERLISRQTKLTEQHDRITQANIQGLNEKERKAAEAVAREADQHRRETDLQNHISALAHDLREIQIRTHNHWREIESLEKQDLSQRQKLLMNSGPLTPEGDLPGTRSQPPASRPFSFGNYNGLPGSMMSTEPKASPFLAYAKTLPSENRRPRSETNRSFGAGSNFSADFEDADPIPPMPGSLEYDINGRSGSGSSRGQNNGSPAAGVMGGNLRSPQRGNHSPGQMPGTTTW